MKERKKRKNILIFIIQLILIGIMLYSGYSIGSYYYQNWRSTQQLNEANDIVKSIEEDEDNVVENSGNSKDKNKKPRKKTKAELDALAKKVIKRLKEKNEDIVAFIKFDEAKINFPVVYTKENNDYYLFRDLDENWSRPGTIFLNGFNNNDFNDMNTTLFGHNLRTDPELFAPMFKLLLQFEKSENVDPNKEYIVEIYTDQGYRKYKVFSAYYSTAQDDYIASERDKSEWVDYQKQLKEKSINQFKLKHKFTEDDKILTLSTCDSGDTEVGNDGRFVVHAYEINEY